MFFFAERLVQKFNEADDSLAQLARLFALQLNAETRFVYDLKFFDLLIGQRHFFENKK